MTPDEREALSRRYSNDIIIALSLRSGRVAVFNSARDLCGIVERIEDARSAWHPPTALPPERKSNLLEELGLL